MKNIDFRLSDFDRKAIADAGEKRAKLSVKDLSEARKSSFIPWNCRFDECGRPASPAKKTN